MHFDTNRKAAKILSSGEIDKYQYFRWEQNITLSKQNNRRIKEQAKFTYSSVEKILEK